MTDSVSCLFSQLTDCEEDVNFKSIYFVAEILLRQLITSNLLRDVPENLLV